METAPIKRELRGLKEKLSEFDEIEARIKEVFKKELYYPLARMFAFSEKELIRNAKMGGPDTLQLALRQGRVTYKDGVFSGKFNAALTRELRQLGATWSRNNFLLPLDEMPMALRQVIATSHQVFLDHMAQVDRELSQVLPEKIADSIQTADLFDSTLWRLNRDVNKTLKGITVPFKMTPDVAARISKEWAENLKLYIQDFARDEILKLRQDVAAAVFSGNRYESLVTAITDSYGVTQRKAKFLARQETSLMVTKFKEARYTEAGITEYRWQCVAGSKAHPVRPAHKKLDGSIQKWNDPPITSEPGDPVRRNNPGQDFNCRCIARPIVRFKS